MKLRTQPVAKQPQQPYTRCLHVRLGHRLSSCFIPTACCIADTAAESLTPLTAPFALPAALPTLTLIEVSAVLGSSSFFLNGLRVLSWTSFGSFLPILGAWLCFARAGRQRLHSCSVRSQFLTSGLQLYRSSHLSSRHYQHQPGGR